MCRKHFAVTVTLVMSLSACRSDTPKQSSPARPSPDAILISGNWIGSKDHLNSAVATDAASGTHTDLINAPSDFDQASTNNVLVRRGGVVASRPVGVTPGDQPAEIAAFVPSNGGKPVDLGAYTSEYNGLVPDVQQDRVWLYHEFTEKRDGRPLLRRLITEVDLTGKTIAGGLE